MKRQIAVFMCMLAGCLTLAGCGANTNHISDFKISYLSNEGMQECANEFAEIVKMQSGTTLKVKTDELTAEGRFIHIGGMELAAQTGEDLSGLSEQGYLFTLVEDDIYFYALSDAGYYRGFNYFLSIMDEKGNMNFPTQRVVDTGKHVPLEVVVGETALSEYVIVLSEDLSKNGEKAATELRKYICETTGAYLEIVDSKDLATEKNIILQEFTDEEIVAGKTGYEIRLESGDIYICSTKEACLDGVYGFVNTYLGWAFAGEDREHISTQSDILRIPEDNLFLEGEPWMGEREAIICLWKTNTARGAYYDGNASLKSEIMTYSDDQIYEYIKMLKYCGFTGIQVTDMCSNWAAYGGYEFVHDRLRFMADAAHSMDMKFTLWVWGAEFTGYGWVDDTVTYTADGYESVQSNPAVIATFDKYYSIYAELADCCDRVIAHYSDPGQLKDSNDIGYFANVLRGKFLSVNPDIDFGVSCWKNDIDRAVLRYHLGADWTVYEAGHYDNSADRDAFRSNCNYLGIRYGTWSWGAAEAEIDQMALMNVNAEILQELYQEVIATGDGRGKSTYWSEMDSYHVVNVFSLYCSGHLLQDPYADSEMLLRQIAQDTVGTEYADAFYEILDLIQDTRSGSSWSTYAFRSPEYIIKSDAYDADDILNRCNEYIPVLEEMIESGEVQNTIPLPIEVKELLQLILPHMEQIRQFAEFRKGMYELEDMYAQGASKEELQAKVNEVYDPIPEYNCLVGMFGQPEAKAQYEMTEAFCEKAGLSVPRDPVFTYYQKQRIYQELCAYQKSSESIYYVKKGAYQFNAAWSEDVTIKLYDELIAEGILGETEDGYVYLTDWEDYRYHFN